MSTGPGRQALDAVETVFREHRGRLLAALATRLGDLDLAEEVAAEAVELALRRWPTDGVPSSPFAWLLTTARRRAVDRIRRDRRGAERLAELAVESERSSAQVAPEDDDGLPDERLTLFFTCCHPALPLETQVALTLRFLAGLTTAEVATAFLVPVTTMQQRIVRAKRKIERTRIPFRAPRPDELQQRMPAVLHVVHLVFSEGYASSSGEDHLRADLSQEAIRLAQLLHRLVPGHREVSGLLALLLLTDARRDARVDAEGVPIPLQDQARDRWDAATIDEGHRVLAEALAGGTREVPAGPWTVQAAIAALHVESPDVESTDWPQVVALYDVLRRLAPSPVIELNRAVALAMRDGPDAGLARLAELDATAELVGYASLPVAQAELLTRAGRHAEAITAYNQALALANGSAERRYLRRQLDALALWSSRTC